MERSKRSINAVGIPVSLGPGGCQYTRVAMKGDVLVIYEEERVNKR